MEHFKENARIVKKENNKFVFFLLIREIQTMPSQTTI